MCRSTHRSDSSFENYTASSTATKRDYALFYTQTTLLALIAGYLVLLKSKVLITTKRCIAAKNKGANVRRKY